MHKNPGEAVQFLENVAPLVATSQHAEIVICAPFVDLPSAVTAAAHTNIEIGAQDLFWLTEGAYTGEISGPMLVAVGCRWVIIGHSERRQLFSETDETVFKKIQAAIAVGLKPIVCVGESLPERESARTDTILERQFTIGMGRLTREQFSKVVIAYEPVWAIGSGRSATPSIAAAAHKFLRERIRQVFGPETASASRIIYGGSVKPDSVQALMAQPEIDGALVGGASLDVNSFASIVNF